MGIINIAAAAAAAVEVAAAVTQACDSSPTILKPKRLRKFHVLYKLDAKYIWQQNLNRYKKILMFLVFISLGVKVHRLCYINTNALFFQFYC